VKKSFVKVLAFATTLIIAVGGIAVLGYGNAVHRETGMPIGPDLYSPAPSMGISAEPLPAPILIAHAGAAIEGWQGSNSLEAMQNAANLGFRYIELDMLTSSDGEIVMTHLWHHISNRIPGIRNGIMTHEEFMSHRLFGHFTTIDLDGLIGFLRDNPEPRIITDTKDTDYAALYAIAHYFPQYRNRFIAQAYCFESVARIRALGFEDIILTIYMMPLELRNPAVIHQFAVDESLYAVAMPEYFVVSSFVDHLNFGEMRYIVHTIDSAAEAATLYKMGFYAIYTGFLAYDGDGHVVEVPLPINDHVNRIDANVQWLGDVPEAMLYSLGLPVYVRNGEAVPVRENLMTAPFISPITGLVYLPARHFEAYTERMDWMPRERVLHITRDGVDYIALGEDYDLFIYRDMLFISEDVVRNIFSFEVLRRENYIIVISEQRNEVEINNIFNIAEILFSR